MIDEIVDAYCSVGPYRNREPGTPFELPDLLDEHARNGITARLILHAESRDGVPDDGNAELARLVPDEPGSRSGLIWTALPPRRYGAEDAEGWIARAEAAGVAMVALFPTTNGHHLAPWANGELYAVLEAARLPLVLAMTQATYTDVHEIATAYPLLPLVLWGASYMDERLQVPLLDACPNVHVGLATIAIPTGGIERSVARYGPGRLIFGSAWPLGHRSASYGTDTHRPLQVPGPLLTYVRYAAVPDDAKAAILGGTVRRLLDDVCWPVRGFTPAEARWA